jgi:2-hydroxy-6-oxonona-2,4-dienedioate hydrolase
VVEQSPYTSIWAELRHTPFEQGWLDAGGIRTRYLSSGNPSKPLLLLLHGIGGHAEAYVRNLRPHGERFWTVAIDMVGHGWSDRPDMDYQIRDYGEHVLAVIAALGRVSAMISGESLGGWVASWIAAEHPSAVSKLVLNTAGGWTAHPEIMARLKRLSNEAASDPTPERIRERLRWLMFDKSLVSDDLIETRRAIYAQPGYARTMERIMCLQEMEIRRANMISEEQYRSITAPTLVLWTSHDPTATPEEGREIASMISRSDYVVLNECGHWPQYEKADLFNRLHLAFLLGEPLAGLMEDGAAIAGPGPA